MLKVEHTHVTYKSMKETCPSLSFPTQTSEWTNAYCWFYIDQNAEGLFKVTDTWGDCEDTSYAQLSLDLANYRVTNDTFIVNLTIKFAYSTESEAQGVLSKMQNSMAHAPSAAGITESDGAKVQNCNQTWLKPETSTSQAAILAQI